MHRPISLSAIALALSAASAPQPPRPAADPLQRCLSAAAERENLSGSILVSRGDRIMARVDRGHLEGPGSAPIGPNTRFNLGSASKMFTAVAIGQLIEAGKLRLDEPVGEAVAGLTPAASAVTIRQLLTHSSGLGDFFRPENMQQMLRARTASDILPLIAGDAPAFPPGSRFAYSNSGFALLGIAIERISGLGYGEYLKRHIFKPAGMTETGLDPRPLDTLAVGMTAGGMGSIRPPDGSQGKLMLIGPDGKPAAVQNAAPSGGLVLMGLDGRRMAAAPPDAGQPLRPAPGATAGYGSPAGGLFGTSEDLRRFAAALMAHKLLSPATMVAFTSPQIEAAPAAGDKPARHYGFGFGISEEGGKRWFGHNGGTLGANAEFSVQPDDQWVISVLSNRDPPVATNLMRQARAWVTGTGRGTPCA